MDKEYIDPTQSKKIGKYECIKILGKGNYGEVWHARDTVLQKDVALKCPYPYVPKKAVLEEARKQASIRSDHVVDVATFLEREGVIVMELMDFSLKDEIKKRIKECKPFTMEETLQILRGCTKAIKDAHVRDIVHGDIKPGNIMLSKELKPKLADFGIARRIGRQEFIPGRGSSRWAPPEVIYGHADPDRSSDAFALGVIAYLLLAFRHPFYYEEPSTLFDETDNILDPDFDPPSPRSFRNEISEELENIILGLLSRERGKRLETLEKLEEALEEPPKPERIACPNCGTPNEPGSKFCGNCGGKLVPEPLEEAIKKIQEAIENAKREFFVAFSPRVALDTLETTIKEFKKEGIQQLADCYSLKAFIHNSQRFWDDAVEAATRGLDINPDHVNSLQARGYAYLRLTKVEEAKEDLEKALGLTEDSVKASQIKDLVAQIGQLEKSN